MSEFVEGWTSPQKILVILAHPDDPEFFCGGTIARWARLGHKVHYCLLTRGDKGGDDLRVAPNALAAMREKEEIAAARVLGVENVRFLDNQDGYLTPTLELRKDVVRVIRQEKPDILVTCDPTNFFPRDGYINHPDHRAAGQIVLDAYFPASGNPYFFPELIIEEGLQPHSVKEIWLSLPSQPNVILDVTEDWQSKLEALYEHRSQIGDREKFDERMRSRKTSDSSEENPRYEEKLRRFIF